MKMKTDISPHGGHSHSTHRRGHTFFAIGASLWLASSVLVSLPPRLALAVSTSDVFTLSNNERVANGQAALSPNSKLNAAAQAKAQHMRDNNYFAHTAPDGTTGWNFIANQGYSYTTAGENLAAGNQGASAVVQGWMDSPGHRANLLNSAYTEVGYGVTYVGNWEYNGVVYSDSYYVVALYAKPVSSPPPEPEASSSTPASSESTQVAGNSNSPTPAASQASEEPAADEEIVVEEELSEAIEEPEELTQEQKDSELTPGAASVAKTSSGAIPAGLAILMMTVGSGVIIFGAWHELKWLKHHSHINLHKN